MTGDYLGRIIRRLEWIAAGGVPDPPAGPPRPERPPRDPPGVVVTCAFCGLKFRRRLSQVKGRRLRFCCREHMELHWARTRAPRTLTCERCGKAFTVRGPRAYLKRYCGKACSRAAFKKNWTWRVMTPGRDT
jgi:hypothetical protein